MQSAAFSVPKLDGSSEAEDLANAMTGVSGVAGISVDAAAHTVTIEYDPGYVNADSLREFMTGVGYAAERGEVKEVPA